MDAPDARADSRTPLAGRIVGALVFLVFFVLGLVLAAYFFREAWGNYATRSWTRTECTILESTAPAPQAARDHAPPVIRYEYRWQGRTLTSTQIHRKPTTFRDYQDVQRLLDRYPANTQAVCFVNPAEPEVAVLEREAPWQFLIIAFPLVFAGIGGVGAYAILFGQRSGRKRSAASNPDASDVRSDPDADAASTPISSRANDSNKTGAGCLFVFFLLFGGLGAGIFVAAFVRPWLQSRDAASWTRTPCTILASDVRSHRSDDGTTYSIEILYEYRINGRPYRSNRYTFSRASSSGRDAKAAVVRQHPPGLQTFCYVNPRDPTDAVLVQGLPGETWIALIPLAFALIGLAGMTYAVRLHRRSRSRRLPLRSGEEATTTAATTAAASLRGGFGRSHAAPGDALTDDVDDDNGPDEPVELRAGSSRVGKVVAALLVGAFWNGIVSVFVYQVVQSARRGAFEWFLALFLIPFVLIGLVILGFFFHSLLGLFAPRPVLTLGSTRLRPGSATSVSWRLSGRIEVIEQLRIYLEGREEATYRRGTSTSTDRHVFAEIPVATIEDVAALRSGEGRLALPLEMVPSFASANNKIVWTLRVRGRIRRFPDVDDSFPIEIQPRRIRETSAPSPSQSQSQSSGPAQD